MENINPVTIILEKWDIVGNLKYVLRNNLKYMLRNKGGAQIGYYKVSWKRYLEILLTFEHIKLETTLLTWKHKSEF